MSKSNNKNDLRDLSLVNQIRFLLFLYYLKLRERAIRLQFVSRRSRVHWVGRAKRPRRPERLLFAILLYAAMLVLEPFEYMVWAVVWGSAASIFVIVRSVGLLVESRSW